jgi:hypothetical protein
MMSHIFQSDPGWLVELRLVTVISLPPNEPDIPVMEPTRFQLVINLMKVPPTLLARADEVLE